MASCVIKSDHNVRNGKQEVNIMWTSQSMTLLESLTVSAMGLTVVLGVLSMLAIAIVLFSKLLNLGGKKAAPAAPQPAGPHRGGAMRGHPLGYLRGAARRSKGHSDQKHPQAISHTDWEVNS